MRLIATSGSTQALDLVCRAFLDPGDGVAVEAPTYLGAVRILHHYGAGIRGFDVTDQGIDLDGLEAALRGGWRPKLAYVMANFQNPTG